MGWQRQRCTGARRWREAVALAVALAAPPAAAGCSAPGATPPSTVSAVGAENQYADVLSQVGGRFVHVTSILDNPNTDPHTFESSPRIAGVVSSARLVVQNGLGYDAFMQRIEAAAPSSNRKVIVVQQLLGLPDGTPNPHLWYSPQTMAKVARAMAADLSAIDPRHAASYRANLDRFDASMAPWTEAIASFRARFPAVPAATTEPVADYLLDAMGVEVLTPFRFQAAVMNGVDPSPQDIASERAILAHHEAKVFCFNRQVVDALTSSLEGDARAAHVPVVAMYETMPSGYTYQSWMLAEVRALTAAVTSGKSTDHL